VTSPDKSERIGDIDYWWSGHSSGAFHPPAAIEARLFRAFYQVLSVLSDEEFETFMTLSPDLICTEPETQATAFRLVQAVPPQAKQVTRYFIAFAAPIASVGDDELADTVAHEVAHLLLGHCDVGTMADAPASEKEAAADAQAKGWGFRPSYCSQVLKDLRAQEQRTKGPTR
jgi:hypothetical protein